MKRLLKTTKKGNIVLIFLFVILFLSALFGLFTNYYFGFEASNRVKLATNEVARIRANAIDTPLKEQTGIVEMLHPNPGSSYNGTIYNDPNDSHPATDVGHKTIRPPSSTQYRGAFDAANASAITAGTTLIRQSMGKNSSNVDSISNISICFDFKAIPQSAQNITFSCNAGGTVVTQTIPIPAASTYKSTVLVRSNGTTVTNDVRNMVFVGVAYDYHFLWSKMVQNAGGSGKVRLKAYSVGFPQVDKCIAGSNGC